MDGGYSTVSAWWNEYGCLETRLLVFFRLYRCAETEWTVHE